MIGEERARRILFLRALDEVDTDDLLLGPADWERARKNGVPDGDDAFRLDALAGSAHADLERRHGPVPAHWWQAPWKFLRRIVWPAAFLLGLATNYLGPAGEVNLLLNPFMGLLLWNLAIYIILLLRLVMRRSSKLASASAGNLLVRAAERLAALPLTSSKGLAPKRRLLVAARLRFLHDWHETFPKLGGYRASALLHGAAAFLVIGVIAGLYLRGLALACHFNWPSTFLAVDDETARQSILQAVFGPALLLSGPLFDGIPSTQTTGNGADWINLFAFAGLIYIAVPRALLTWWTARCAGRAAALAVPPLERAWFMKLLAPLRGQGCRLVVTAYSYSLPEAQQSGVASLGRSLWGERLEGMTIDRAEWGDEAPDWSDNDDAVRMVVFNGVQTPEREVHGVFAEAAREAAGETPLLIAVDASRVNETEKPGRREAWQTTVGPQCAWLKLDEPGTDDIDKAAAAVQRNLS